MQILWAAMNGEMEFSGTSLELLKLVKALRVSRESCRLDVTADPAPYSKALSTLETRQTSGKVLISVSSDRETLKIQGGRNAMEMLASTVEEFAAEGDGAAHLHVEYLPGHEYLSQESEPLVIALVS